VANELTLSTTEAGRFLHTAPSTLGGTSVSAFTPSWFRDYLHDQMAQDYIKDLADQSNYIIIGDWRSEWQMTQETMDYILRRAVIVKDLGYIV
jgi:hypothetical protein